jgi:hypothetical protein
MHLVLDEFKTRKKKQGAHEVDLPADLVAVLAKSFEARPRKYLVLSPETGGPYVTASGYAQYVTRVFSAMLGSHTTINSLRHAFSSQLDLNTLTPKQRKEIADALMHSPEMTHRYRYANVEGSQTSADAVVGSKCELVCTKPKKPAAIAVAAGAKKSATKAERYRAATDLFDLRMRESGVIAAT